MIWPVMSDRDEVDRRVLFWVDCILLTLLSTCIRHITCILHLAQSFTAWEECILEPDLVTGALDMSDDFDFDDDDFNFDDSFLREVDNIEAKATTQKSVPVSHVVLPGFTKASKVHYPPLGSRSSPFSRPTPAGPSRLFKTPPQASSDDFDDFSFSVAPESLAEIDALSDRPRSFSRTTSASASHARPQSKQTVIPSSRLGMARSTSGSLNGFQTHLNFRKENQSTKGKRWDRTEFAESGRRITIKGKDGQLGGDDGDEEEEEEFEPLVPGPKPLVDPRE